MLVIDPVAIASVAVLLAAIEIAQAAVDQLGRCGGGAAPEIGLLAKVGRKTTAGRIAGNAATVNPSTDDGNVVSPVHPIFLKPARWR
jgi:hypothetical protein